MDNRIDEQDWRLEISRHVPSGELYVLRYNSLWDVNDECVGWTYTACCGPLVQREWLDDAGQPAAGWLERARDLLDNQSAVTLAQDAAWANGVQWNVLSTQP